MAACTPTNRTHAAVWLAWVIGCAPRDVEDYAGCCTAAIGGGDELHGTLDHGITPVGVRRRGRADALAFGDTKWSGSTIDTAERLRSYLVELR